MAQSVFLCPTRPVFSQEKGIFNVFVRNKSAKHYHYLDSYRLISTVVKMSTTFYLSFNILASSVCLRTAETIENCGGFVNFITLTCKPGDPGRPAGPVMPRKPLTEEYNSQVKTTKDLFHAGLLYSSERSIQNSQLLGQKYFKCIKIFRRH